MGAEIFIRDSFFFQAEDGIRALVRSRGLGDVYKRQVQQGGPGDTFLATFPWMVGYWRAYAPDTLGGPAPCLLYTSDAADERSSVDLGGRRTIKKKNTLHC